MRAALAVAALAVATVVGLGSAAQRHPFVADSLGYVTAGRGLTDGDGLAWHDDVNAVAGPFSSPLAFPVRRGDTDELRFGYPAGLPVLIAMAVAATGRDGAATLVVPLVGGLVVVSTAWLAWAATRSRWTAVGAAALVALVPDLWRFGTDAWADVPAAALAPAGVAALLSLRRVRLSSAWAHAVAGGVALGALCWVRPAGLALVAAVALAVAATRRRWSPSWRPLVLAGGVAAVGVLALLAWQARWFGDPFSTGYSPEHGWYPHRAFDLAYAFGPSFVDGRSVPALIATLWHDLGPAVLAVPLGLVALGRRRGILVGAAAVGALGPYTVYAFAPTDENARFVLPALPFLCVAAVAGVAALASRWRPTVVCGVAAALLAVGLGPAALAAWDDARDAADDGEARVGRAVAIAERTAADTVLVSFEWNDLLAVHGGRSVLNTRRIPPADVEAGRYRTELLAPCLTAAVDRLLAAGRPVAYVEGAFPPALDALAVLRSGFELRADGADPVIWHVVARRGDHYGASIEPCRSAVVPG